MNTLRTSSRAALLTASLLGALGIAAAAFHAHGLERLVSSQKMEFWETAVFIQLVTLPVVVGLVRGKPDRMALRAAWTLMVGLLLFSGSLFAMTLGAPRWLGAVTPLGGVCLIIGWILLGFSKK